MMAITDASPGSRQQPPTTRRMLATMVTGAAPATPAARAAPRTPGGRHQRNRHHRESNTLHGSRKNAAVRGDAQRSSPRTPQIIPSIAVSSAPTRHDARLSRDRDHRVDHNQRDHRCLHARLPDPRRQPAVPATDSRRLGVVKIPLLSVGLRTFRPARAPDPSLSRPARLAPAVARAPLARAITASVTAVSGSTTVVITVP